MDLLEDVLTEILVRLPVKSLLQCRCVCKAWCALIKNPCFMDLHLSRAKMRKNNCVLVKRFIEEERKMVLSFHFLHGDEEDDEGILEVPCHYEHTMNLIETCNGIVCFRAPDGRIHLCNPATREFQKLPHSSLGFPQGFRHSQSELGFGYDPITDDYKVVNISFFQSCEVRDLLLTRAEIFNVRSNSWREHAANLPLIMRRPCYSVLFNGYFHWCAITEYDFEILSFHMSTEVFCQIKLPDQVKRCEAGHLLQDGRLLLQKLVVLDNSLAMIFYTRTAGKSDCLMDIWVMMEYGVQESWIKKCSIGPLSGIRWPLSSWNNDKLLLAMENGQLASCSLQTDSEEEIKKYNVYGSPTSMEAVIYQESLVSLSDRKMNE